MRSEDRWGTAGGGLAVAVWTVLLAGLFFHHSSKPVVLGRFSPAYALGLVLAAAALPAVFLAARSVFSTSEMVSAEGRVRRVGPLAKSALVAGSALVTFALAQLVLSAGSHRYPVPVPSLRHPFLQAVPAPGAALGVNRRGFRGPEVRLPKPANLVRVLLLGGSTSFGYGLAYEDSYGHRLEKELEKTLGPGRVEVQAAAAPGFNTEHVLIRYAADAADIDPDVVLVMEGVNDLLANVVPVGSFRSDYGHMVRLDERPRWFDRTGLVPTIAFVTRYVLFSDFRAGPQPSPYDREPDARPFRRNLRAIAAVAASRHQRLVLCTQPHHYDEHGRLETQNAAWHDRNMRLFNQEARAVASEEGLPLLDFEKEIPPRDDLFMDVVHVTAKGAELEARAAARFLEEHGLLR